MEEEYEEEIVFLKDIEIENVTLNSKDGIITLAELLNMYALEWHCQHGQGEYGRYQ